MLYFTQNVSLLDFLPFFAPHVKLGKSPSDSSPEKKALICLAVFRWLLFQWQLRLETLQEIICFTLTEKVTAVVEKRNIVLLPLLNYHQFSQCDKL